MSLFSCAGKRPTDIGLQNGRLAPCPSSPNCVSSESDDRIHGIPAFVVSAAPDQAWAGARQAVLDLPRTTIVVDEPGYLHAECQSALMGFVDDLELHARPDAGRIDVRSASRLGYGDLGVNRRRVETLRANLRAQGLVE
ncbi:MAG: DUF1499 domain-containing protein [Myxococcota bacterium]|nr:DUF1499 domain-containing protein [Myxococcota bacterium]